MQESRRNEVQRGVIRLGAVSAEFRCRRVAGMQESRRNEVQRGVIRLGSCLSGFRCSEAVFCRDRESAIVEVVHGKGSFLWEQWV